VEGDESSTTTDAVPAWSFKDREDMWKRQGLDVAGVSFGLHASLLVERAYRRLHVDDQPLVLKMGRSTFCYFFDDESMGQLDCEVRPSRPWNESI
jgi:hypothetical protein